MNDFVVEVAGELTCSDTACHEYVEELLVDMVVAMNERGYDEASFGAEFGLNRFTGTFIVTAQSEDEGRKVARYLLDQICEECRGDYEDDNGEVIVQGDVKIEVGEHLIAWNTMHLALA